MIPPSLVLSVLIGSLLGLAFFYAFGRKKDKMVASWGVAVVAFLAGQVAGSIKPVSSLMWGEVHILEASAVCLIALVAMHFSRTIK